MAFAPPRARILALPPGRAEERELEEKTKGKGQRECRYSMLIASLGQLSTHAPQSPHVDSSITATPSFTAMASKGQEATHCSHPEHFSVSTFAAMEVLQVIVEIQSTPSRRRKTR